jgi:Rps23 Pro-64 3,4-dihydroxylase Tpa1-like proline 4-hydroxylase
MTAKQILDSFSETLMEDERILTARERDLLGSILRSGKATSNANPETHAAVNAVIASAVGETVAQRAFAVLGGSIVERIVAAGATDVAENTTAHVIPEPLLSPAQPPQPPGAEKPVKGPAPPQPPGYKPPQPPGTHKPSPGPAKGPAPPQPPGAVPQPPGHGLRPEHVKMQASDGSGAELQVGVIERPEVLRAQCVVLDEFLAPQELEQLTSYVLQHETDFAASEVISPAGGVTDYEHRRSQVLMDPGLYQDLVLERIKQALPAVFRKLGMEEHPVTRTEFQVTASNDGDFFRMHADNAHEEIASRYLTFVYFFHREPKQFEGGELRIHDSRLEEGRYVSAGTYQTIVPQQNQIVFFPCELMHEITPVECPSRAFADSRFTLNGWLHR